MLAPVVALMTGACFATTNDVIRLQGDVNNSRRDLEQRITRVEQQQQVRFDSLTRMLTSVVDSIRAMESKFYATGGNIADNTRGVQTLVNTLLARVDAFLTEQESQGRQLNLLTEQVRGITTSLAADSMRTAPVEGPVAKLEAAIRQFDRSPSTARELAEEALTLATDSLVMADAYDLIGETFRREDKVKEADSVSRIVFERFPPSPKAPDNMFRVALSQQTVRNFPEARMLYQKLIKDYPDTHSASIAAGRLKEIPPILRQGD
jgi:hypothetical protein